jgi:type II secretory pathway predicted ATPase ExeA
MYLDHFGLSEAPFRITPHTEFFFAGANRGATLDALLYAASQEEGIVKVSGEVGSGKTMLCRMLADRLPENVETVYIANPLLKGEEILRAIADELACALPEERQSAMLRTLQQHLIDLYARGRQVVLLVDEAHAVPGETLEEIRLLSNLESQRHKLLHIVLFGQPELDEVLARPDMRQLKDRITHHFLLPPLPRKEVADYIDFRMRAAGYRGPSVFDRGAVRVIAAASDGLTRRINVLADKSLLAAFAKGSHAVSAVEARAAVRDARLGGKPARRVLWLSIAAAAVLASVGALTVMAFNGRSLSEAASAAAAPSAGPAVAPSGGPTESPATPEISVAGPAPPHDPSPATLTPAVAAALGPLTRAHLERTSDWLSAAADDRWFLQLLTADADNAGAVERLLARSAALGLGESLGVYWATTPRGERLGVIYGDYPSMASASAALKELPAAFKAYAPYPRQVRRLR